MSHCRTSTFDGHLDYCFVVFKNVELGFRSTRLCVCGNLIDIDQVQIILFGMDLGLVVRGCLMGKCETSMIKSHKSAGIPSMRRLASSEVTSDSVELCDFRTQVCFLHIQLMGTNV